MTPRVFVAILLAAGIGFGQTAAPTFEAASIKPSKEGEGHSGSHSRTGYMVIQNQTLKQLMQMAYRVRPDQVSGGAKWVTSDRFNVEAKSAGPADEPEMLPMLQSLLAERFQLMFHREPASLPGFAMVVAKGGMKVQPVDGEGSHSNSNRTHLTAERMSMARLADRLSQILGSPVIDKTGAAGAYTFELEWAPDGAPSDAANAGPSIFTALQEKVGVRLESQKVSTEVLVIDKAEKPSEN
jgi:uncharacterized protein (TIGR03435 family)